MVLSNNLPPPFVVSIYALMVFELPLTCLNFQTPPYSIKFIVSPAVMVVTVASVKSPLNITP